MRPTFRVVLATCVVLAAYALAGAVSAYAQSEKPKPLSLGTFSSLRFHKDAGDLLGAEIKVVRAKGKYQAAVQIAEGEPSDLMVVDVQVQHGTISFQIPKSYARYGGGSFNGTVTAKGIKGRFKFGDVVGEEEFLIRRNSYWDR